MGEFVFWKSKTFWGAVALAAATVLNADVISVSVLVEAFGIVLAAVGIRHGVAKVSP